MRVHVLWNRARLYLSDWPSRAENAENPMRPRRAHALFWPHKFFGLANETTLACHQAIRHVRGGAAATGAHPAPAPRAGDEPAASRRWRAGNASARRGWSDEEGRRRSAARAVRSALQQERARAAMGDAGLVTLRNFRHNFRSFSTFLHFCQFPSTPCLSSGNNVVSRTGWASSREAMMSLITGWVQMMG